MTQPLVKLLMESRCIAARSTWRPGGWGSQATISRKREETRAGHGGSVHRNLLDRVGGSHSARTNRRRRSNDDCISLLPVGCGQIVYTKVECGEKKILRVEGDSENPGQRPSPRRSETGHATSVRANPSAARKNPPKLTVLPGLGLPTCPSPNRREAEQISKSPMLLECEVGEIGAGLRAIRSTIGFAQTDSKRGVHP
jgi:hypothetical protein